GRMAMNDEETVALIAGGHTFGKAHGAANPDQYVGPEPEAAPIEDQGLGWISSYGTGNAGDTITSGLEGAWTSEPAKWDNGYFDNLFGYDWELTQSPAGANQWTPKNDGGQGTVPDAHDPDKRHAPMMFTTDIALREDPAYGPISKRFHENPDEFADAFARAWFKLTHRDMGPTSRYVGSLVPGEELIWQDPIPAVDHELINEADIAELKAALLDTGLSIAELTETAWASASSFRGTDKRGGANGGRIRLAPQKDWAANKPDQLQKVLTKLEEVQAGFGKTVSLADLIVLGGCAAVEAAAKAAGFDVTVPFTPGRMDASAEQTDAESFDALEPATDGFRNFVTPAITRPYEELLVDKATLLTLSAAEMTVLVGGLRALNVTNAGLGVFTDRPETLTNDFFVNLLDLDTTWAVSEQCSHFYEGRSLSTNEVKWNGSAADLIFGSSSQLRAIAEVYGCDDAKEKFVKDFIAAWDKVMNLDRF
ncbi:MAG: peroxidase family protein, partial [Verrucomicrobiota bacterium]